MLAYWGLTPGHHWLLWSSGLNLCLSIRWLKKKNHAFLFWQTGCIGVKPYCSIWLNISLIVRSPEVVMPPAFYLVRLTGMLPSGSHCTFVAAYNVNGMFQFLMFAFLEIFLKQRKTALESRLQKFLWPSQQKAVDLMPLSDHNLYITEPETHLDAWRA